MTTEVLIVGGGPAGATCAWQLRRAGFDVVVWDRRTFPRDKVCAGWITPQVVAELELDPNAYAATGRTFQVIHGFRVSRLGDADTRVHYDHPVSYGIRRCEFDHYLLQRSGAELRLGEPVRSLRREKGEWILNDTLRAPVVIGAGGHFCPVAQHLGARLGDSEPIVAAQEAELEMTEEQERACAVEPDVPEIFFTRDLKGYGWVFRKGRFVNIGLGRQDKEKLGQHVAAFFAFLEERGKIPRGLPVKLRGHPYLLYGQAPRPLSADGALLVGDAAGLAYGKSGEGIRPAIESGILAAQTIAETAGQYDRDLMREYDRRIVERFGARQGGRGVTDVLPEWAACGIAGFLLGTSWFARRVVMERWFFHAHQPALAVGSQSVRRDRPVADGATTPHVTRRAAS